MKRTSLQDPGGFVYPCANYDTVLSNRNYLISMVCSSYFVLFMYFVFLRESFSLKVVALLGGFYKSPGYPLKMIIPSFI